MTENPIYPKLISRPDKYSDDLFLGQQPDKVEYTGLWEKVEGGKNVFVRTWKLSGTNGADVDGADIEIKAGGYTPIQRVNDVHVVVDAPENYEDADCIVLDTDGQIYVNHFDSTTTDKQMVFSPGMLICWVAKRPLRFTEFESPGYTKDMFTNIADNDELFKNGPAAEYSKKVKELRTLASHSEMLENIVQELSV